MLIGFNWIRLGPVRALVDCYLRVPQSAGNVLLKMKITTYKNVFNITYTLFP